MATLYTLNSLSDVARVFRNGNSFTVETIRSDNGRATVGMNSQQASTLSGQLEATAEGADAIPNTPETTLARVTDEGHSIRLTLDSPKSIFALDLTYTQALSLAMLINDAISDYWSEFFGLEGTTA